MSTNAQALYDRYFPGNTGQSWTYGSVHDGASEQGTDIYIPAGTPIRLPAAGKLVWSNGYQDVFQTDVGGLGESITHIVNSAAVGADIAAGSVIGTVAPLSATPPGYYSSAEHIELGVYNTPQGAESWDYSVTRDPVAWLANLAGGAVSTPTPPGTPPAGTALNGTPPPQPAPTPTGNPPNSANGSTFSLPGLPNPGDIFGGLVKDVAAPLKRGLVLVALAVALIGVLLILAAHLFDASGAKALPVPV